MYIPELNLFVVNVPKCGTNTLNTAIERVYGRRCLPGHVTVDRARKCLGHDFTSWALIRDPWDRFASAMNFVYGDSDISLDDAMNGALRHNTVVMLPQVHFIAPETRLFPFEALPEVVRLLGYTGPMPHENRSVKRWTVGDCKAQARAPEVAERYAADFAARRRLADDR